jgi:repressor LexA
MKEVTARQHEVLVFISGYIRSHKYPPTIREIGQHFGMSVKGAYDHILALKKKGKLTWERQSRTMELTTPAPCGRWDGMTDDVDIPILGNVAAGLPLMAVENYDGSVFLHHSLLNGSKSYFAVRVQGDSMIGAGIMDGDLAIIEQQETADNGQIVIAMINDAMTLKRFFRERYRIRLQAENPAYPPFFSRNVQILGRLAHVLRSY